MELTFKCNECGEYIEIYQFGSDFHVVSCPQCTEKLQDQISDLETEKAELENDIKDYTSKIEKLESQIESDEDTIHELSNRIDGLEIGN